MFRESEVLELVQSRVQTPFSARQLKRWRRTLPWLRPMKVRRRDRHGGSEPSLYTDDQVERLCHAIALSRLPGYESFSVIRMASWLDASTCSVEENSGMLDRYTVEKRQSLDALPEAIRDAFIEPIDQESDQSEQLQRHQIGPYVRTKPTREQPFWEALLNSVLIANTPYHERPLLIDDSYSQPTIEIPNPIVVLRQRESVTTVDIERARRLCGRLHAGASMIRLALLKGFETSAIPEKVRALFAVDLTIAGPLCMKLLPEILSDAPLIVLWFAAQYRDGTGVPAFFESMLSGLEEGIATHGGATTIYLTATDTGFEPRALSPSNGTIQATKHAVS